MANLYYTKTFDVTPGSSIGSLNIENQFLLVEQGFDAAQLAVVAGANAWVSGTTYVVGDQVYSPIDFQTYVRKVAGAGTTDPSVDTTNWEFRKLTLSSEIPQNSQSAAYPIVLTDAGKHIFHPSADTSARTWTIPANASVAFRIGTTITFINQASAGVITISITSDTMRLAALGTTGSRTLAANGVATAVKVTSTEWIISGTGLT